MINALAVKKQLKNVFWGIHIFTILNLNIGVAGSFSGGANHSVLPKFNPFLPKISPVRGGPSSQILFCQAAVPSYSAKLFCKLAKMADKWLKNEQKWRKNWNMWQKATKNSRKYIKIIENLPRFSFLSCQAPISVLPSFHFCPAKHSFLSCQAN